MAFDDFAVIVIVQEEPDGFRSLNDATRVWPDGRVEQLGWPEVELAYRSGTRIPERALIRLTERGGKSLDLEVEALGHIALHVGCGYGGDPEWSHGQWKGRAYAEGAVYDYTDPAVTERLRGEWQQWGQDVPLVVLESPYRSLMEPFLEYIEQVDAERPDDFLTVVLPEFVPAKWWHHLFHNQRALLIKGALLFKPNVVVTSVPFHLRH
jgi:hypothetical protein